MEASRSGAYNPLLRYFHPIAEPAMSKFQDLTERVERLLLKHQELLRTHQLLAEQLSSVSLERNSLRSRLNAARGRIDALLERLPADISAAAPETEHATSTAGDPA
jgi:cell division protein ZapB